MSHPTYDASQPISKIELCELKDYTKKPVGYECPANEFQFVIFCNNPMVEIMFSTEKLGSEAEDIFNAIKFALGDLQNRKVYADVVNTVK